MTEDELLTEDEFYALPEVRHTVWCDGTHNADGECVIEAKLGSSQYDATVGMNGVPTDHQYVGIDGVLVTVEEIDAAIALLQQMRERFAAQDVREVELQTFFNERVI